jgi:mono/diheme cytochrome c family protein
MNIVEPERSKGYLGGGNALTDLRGQPIHSANLTFDEETGIGKWSEADLSRAVREGFRPDQTPLRSPMAPMPQLTDADVHALYAYLRAVPKIRNPVPRLREDADLPRDAPLGKRLYFKYSCVSCHGETGREGTADLRQAAQHFGTREALTAWLKDAPRIRPGTRMPAWKGVIAEDEYEPLMAYVLALGNGG